MFKEQLPTIVWLIGGFSEDPLKSAIKLLVGATNHIINEFSDLSKAEVELQFFNAPGRARSHVVFVFVDVGRIQASEQDLIRLRAWKRIVEDVSEVKLVLVLPDGVKRAFKLSELGVNEILERPVQSNMLASILFF